MLLSVFTVQTSSFLSIYIVCIQFDFRLRNIKDDTPIYEIPDTKAAPPPPLRTEQNVA